MSDATNEFSNILNMFRLPSLSNAHQITWAYSTPICKKLESFRGQELSGILTILLQRLSEILVTANQTPEDRQTILTCQAFAASTVLASSNIFALKSTWQQLNLYHRSANIGFDDMLQMGMEILSEPYRQEHPLHLFHGFKNQQSSEALSIASFRSGQSQLQQYLKKKFMVLLIDRIRQCSGAENFKRTNNGLLKRTSQRKMREALDQRGNNQASMLILHKVFVETEFYTPDPQEDDYQRLHDGYQKALIMKNLPTCSLQQTQKHLADIGSSIRSYGNSNMRSLNENVGEYGGSELLDRFSNHNYSDPLENCLKIERQEQAAELKQLVHEQIKNLKPIQMESFWLKANGQNDSQIAKIQSIGASSTVKRHRDKTISKFLNISIDQNFSAIADIYMEVAQEYFEVNTH
jgi:hypothetical protein